MSRWRLAALGAAGVGVTYLGLRTAFDDDFDLYNVGAARCVYRVSWMLYVHNVDTIICTGLFNLSGHRVGLT